MAKRAKKRKKIGLIIILIIVFIIVLCGILVGKFIADKIGNLNIEEIDKGEVSANDNLYDQLSDDLSESEYKNIKTLVLFGIDTQGFGDGQDDPNFKGRSDTIIVLGIDSNKKNLKMISIPRDTYVEIEGYGKNKINHAYAWGGPQLAIKTINQNFGLNLTEYITIDIANLIHVINEIGGIEVKISYYEMIHINDNSIIEYGISGNKQKKLTKYGTVTLDGEQAVTHSRNRDIGDDFSRAGRQRQVLEAIMTKVGKMDAGEISNFMDAFLKEVTTNIKVFDYMGIVSDILLNKSSYFNNVVSAQVPTREYGHDQYIKGIYYFAVDNPEILKEKMLDAIYRK